MGYQWNLISSGCLRPSKCKQNAVSCQSKRGLNYREITIALAQILHGNSIFPKDSNAAKSFQLGQLFTTRTTCKLSFMSFNGPSMEGILSRFLYFTIGLYFTMGSSHTRSFNGRHIVKIPILYYRPILYYGQQPHAVSELVQSVSARIHYHCRPAALWGKPFHKEEFSTTGSAHSPVHSVRQAWQCLLTTCHYLSHALQ